MPAVITTDQGLQFTSSMWSSSMEALGIRHITTSPYYPQSDGMVERFHRHLKDALQAKGASVTWSKELPMVMLALRCAPLEDNNISPSEMVYGSVLSLPSPFLDARQPPADDFLHQLRMTSADLPVVATNSASMSKPSWMDGALKTCSHVWLRRDRHVKLLTPLYDGPYMVLSRMEMTFTLQIGTRMQFVSVDRLKPVHAEDDVVATSAWTSAAGTTC